MDRNPFVCLLLSIVLQTTISNRSLCLIFPATWFAAI